MPMQIDRLRAHLMRKQSTFVPQHGLCSLRKLRMILWAEMELMLYAFFLAPLLLYDAVTKDAMAVLEGEDASDDAVGDASSGATDGDINDLMGKGTIKLEKVKTVELPRKPEWFGW